MSVHHTTEKAADPMYTQEEYLYGWMFYLLGVIIILGCGWWLTASIRFKELRQLVRLVAVVTFLVPWYASPEMDYLAPAWLIATFEGIFESGEAFWRAGIPWLSALAVAITVTIAWQIAMRLRFRSSPPSQD